MPVRKNPYLIRALRAEIAGCERDPLWDLPEERLVLRERLAELRAALEKAEQDV